MARKTKSGKELAFHKGTKRWYKTYKGKEYYFGPGTSVRDTRSYEAALQQYYPWLQEREAADRLLRIRNTHNAVMEGGAPVADLGTSPWAMRIVSDLRRRGLVNDEGYVDADPTITIPPPFGWKEGSEDTFQPQAQKPTRERTKTVSNHIDAWLAAEKLRVNAGQLTATAHRDKTNGVKTLREFVGRNTFGKPGAVDQLLVDYKAHLLKKVADGTFTENTANDKSKFARQFMLWAWEHNVLKDQPRQLATLGKKLHVEKKGRPLSVQEVQKLWDAAGDKMKCYIALGLNCAFKNGDITALTGSWLQGDRLVGYRQKTIKHKVPMNYKLWPLTQKLVKSQRMAHGDDELLFVNTKGGRIESGTFSSLFKNLANKAGVKATFEQLRDTSAEQVKQVLFSQGGDLGLLQVFLAHKDKSTAAYYVSDDPAHLKSPKLDKIVMGMQKTYGIK